jgi:hypothetical protein
VKLIPVLLVFFGVLLIYSAHADKDPRNVIFEALGVKMRVPDPAGIGEIDLGPGTFQKHTAGASTSPNTAGQKVVSV